VSKTSGKTDGHLVLKDHDEVWPGLAHRVIHKGHVVTFVEDDITSPSGERLTREMLSHPGSVAILALDENQRVAVVHQYRHPVEMRLVELPAGLLDVAGEPPLDAAKRELAEEAGLAADDWRVLVDICCSPGITDEVGRIYLARHLKTVPPPGGFETRGEEVDMGLAWLSLDDLIAGIRAGQLHNLSLVLGVQALLLAMHDDAVESLRPGDTPWPLRDRVAGLKAGRN